MDDGFGGVQFLLVKFGPDGEELEVIGKEGGGEGFEGEFAEGGKHLLGC